MNLDGIIVLKGPMLWIAVVTVPLIGIGLIALLMQLPAPFRRPLIGALVFAAGLFYALEYFYPVNPATQENFLSPMIANIVDPLAQVLSGMLIGVGLISISRIHVRNVVQQRTGWVYSLALLMSVVGMAIIAFWSRANTGDHPDVDQIYSYLFEGMLQNMDAAMFSLIAFYILSAAYRAFRIRSFEASLLMISALIVVMGLTFGILVTNFIPPDGFVSNLRIENWSNWLLSVVSSPSLRAVDFGIGVGAFAIALRIWLSIERGALFGE